VAKAERAQAERSGNALPGALERVREAEVAAQRSYVAGVEAQRGAKADSVWNRLTVQTSPEVAEAWAREVVGRPEVAAELQAVMEAAGQRLGEDGVRVLLRAAAAPTSQEAGPREGVAGMAAIGRVLTASYDGRRAREAQERARESQRQSLSPRQGHRPRI